MSTFGITLVCNSWPFCKFCSPISDQLHNVYLTISLSKLLEQEKRTTWMRLNWRSSMPTANWLDKRQFDLDLGKMPVDKMQTTSWPRSWLCPVCTQPHVWQLFWGLIMVKSTFKTLSFVPHDKRIVHRIWVARLETSKCKSTFSEKILSYSVLPYRVTCHQLKKKQHRKPGIGLLFSTFSDRFGQLLPFVWNAWLTRNLKSPFPFSAS